MLADSGKTGKSGGPLALIEPWPGKGFRPLAVQFFASVGRNQASAATFRLLERTPGDCPNTRSAGLATASR